MTKKLARDQIQNRKPVSRACVFCHKKHLQCDLGRPCTNCVKRNLHADCRTKERRNKKRRPESFDRFVPVVSTKSSGNIKVEKPPAHTEEPQIAYHVNDDVKPNEESDLNKVRSLNTILNSTNSFLEGRFINPSNNVNTLDTLVSLSTENAHQPDVRDTLYSSASVKSKYQNNDELDFDNIWTDEKYMEFKSMIDLAKDAKWRLNNEEEKHMKPIYNDPLMRIESRPFISLDLSSNLTTSEKNYREEDSLLPLNFNFGTLTKSKPKEKNQGPKNLSPYEARLIFKNPNALYEKRDIMQPYNYKQAYKSLLKCLFRMFLTTSSMDAETTKLRNNQLTNIAKSIIDKYATNLIALATTLIENDLILEELILQRTLLDIEGMSKFVGLTPIAVWRRSCEICYVSNEFSQLTGFNKKEVLDSQKFIVEFMDHASVLHYFEDFHCKLSYGEISLNAKENCIYTQCNLLMNTGTFLKCTCCWSVIKDTFSIPLLIAGYFLPIVESHG